MVRRSTPRQTVSVSEAPNRLQPSWRPTQLLSDFEITVLYDGERYDEAPVKRLRHAQLERLAFIWRRLELRGEINRVDLQDEFAISQPQASIDFRHFREMWPGVIAYDQSRKRYVRADA